MNLLLNGQEEEVRAQTVAGLVSDLGLAPETVLVEHNGTALLRSEWAHTALSDNDRLEILRVAAGG
ncbi:MAG TPA: sulfur carrier protein ThiS [Terrimicrobiaceae bacterium]